MPEVNMQDLIERLEKATGPDREIDKAIAIAMMAWDLVRYLPRYSESVDVALTLLPEGIDIELCRDLARPAGKLWFAYLSAGDPTQTKFAPCEGRADTPAIALCIAILKARMKLTSDDPAS